MKSSGCEAAGFGVEEKKAARLVWSDLNAKKEDMSYMVPYKSCQLCPRSCKADRTKAKGRCHTTDTLLVARAALHMWEEPCISGENGSGAVFFSGCSLGCLFCQNHEISAGQTGRKITKERLVELFFALKEQGANNINLVTPDHFLPQVAWAMERAKEQKLNLPFIYNCSGYETTDSLKMLEGLVDVYLPDFKYWQMETARDYAGAADYPQVAKKAVAEMVRQCSEPVFDEDDIIKRGVIVRHLLLPGKVKEAKQIVEYLFTTFGDRIYLSLMNQFTPVNKIEQYPLLNRKVTKREYERLLNYAVELGVTQAFIQEGETAMESFIPAFHMEGL